jgi:hypothetical protein
VATFAKYCRSPRSLVHSPDDAVRHEHVKVTVDLPVVQIGRRSFLALAERNRTARPPADLHRAVALPRLRTAILGARATPTAFSRTNRQTARISRRTTGARMNRAHATKPASTPNTITSDIARQLRVNCSALDGEAAAYPTSPGQIRLD